MILTYKGKIDKLSNSSSLSFLNLYIQLDDIFLKIPKLEFNLLSLSSMTFLLLLRCASFANFTVSRRPWSRVLDIACGKSQYTG